MPIKPPYMAANCTTLKSQTSNCSAWLSDVPFSCSLPPMPRLLSGAAVCLFVFINRFSNSICHASLWGRIWDIRFCIYSLFYSFFWFLEKNIIVVFGFSIFQFSAACRSLILSINSYGFSVFTDPKELRSIRLVASYIRIIYLTSSFNQSTFNQSELGFN